MKNEFWKKYDIIILFALAKLMIHLAANTNYGFHRDEFLYLEQGNHPGWGYMECPPMIAFLGAIAQWIGPSLGVVRMFPTLAGVLIIVLIGKAVMDLGGGKWAQAFACSGYLFSAAFLRSNMLFQPVTFDQLSWFLLALTVLYLIKNQRPVVWYWIGIVAGIGILTKYSMAFYLLAFIIALIFSGQRRWLATRYPYLAVGIALLIAFPNILWQWRHNFPVMDHMKDLQATQLIHVSVSGFLVSQLMMHLSVLIVWLSGLAALFFVPRWNQYKPIGVVFLVVVGLLLFLSGKDYYTLGAYPVLFIFGGLVLEQWLIKAWYKYALVFFMASLAIATLPYALPVISIPKMEAYCAWMKDNLGMSGPLTWEDGKLYKLPQDYADMNGWEEMTQRLSEAYFNLPEEERALCMLYGGSYSHAAPVSYYRKKYNLPEIHSFNGSFLMWAPDSVDFDRQLMLDDVRNFESVLFNRVVLIDSIRDTNAREKGYLYYRTEPKMDLSEGWKQLVADRKAKYNFN